MKEEVKYELALTDHHKPITLSNTEQGTCLQQAGKEGRRQQ